MTTRHLPTLAATTLILMLTGIFAAACVSKQTLRTTALDDSAWQSAQWISVADAPVVSGPIDDHQNGRAADGASWFVSDVKNDQRIVQARWMTTALGVYELYVNGRPVGEEVLKPGFTHHAKTRRSFTYDITSLINRKAGEQNQLAVQVTPGWWADKIVTQMCFPWSSRTDLCRRHAPFSWH